MKTIFDRSTRGELEGRIRSLTSQSKAQWGKMNVYEMVKHCTLADDMMLGKIKIKRVFIGRLIGPMLLKKYLKDTMPFDKNSPTSPLLKPTEVNADLEIQKKEWLSSLERYTGFNNPEFVHPFFGRMTKEQMGKFVYKHMDHHLRQFGA